jgi:hypothetical protein
MSDTKKKKAKQVTVTLKLNKNGTMSMRSTGGYDLRKLAPSIPQIDASMREDQSD